MAARYMGLLHYMRVKGIIKEAADVVAEGGRGPDDAGGTLRALLERFVEGTPSVPRHLQRAYFVALIQAVLQQRGRGVDPLGLYLLKTALQPRPGGGRG